MKYIVSLSGGKDSTAMLLMMIEKSMKIDEIIFCDTGMEFPEMYEHITKLQEFIKIPITILKADKSFQYYLCEHKKKRARSKKYKNDLGYGFPRMRLNRWCTSKLKQQPFEQYLKKKYGKENVTRYIGIAKDEEKRVKEYKYPLVEWGITEKQALQYCYDKGFDWGGLYEKFKRVSCWCCPLQPLSELKILYRDYKEYWNILKEWEGKVYNNFRVDYTLERLESRFKNEIFLEERQLNLGCCKLPTYQADKCVQFGHKKGVSIVTKKSGFDIKSLLNTAKQNNLKSEAAENSEFEIEYISIYDLIPSQDNFYHVDGINELKNSIELFGVQQNLIVSPTEAGKYKIIAGHRRRMACMELVEEGKKQFEKVPCVVTKEQEYIKEQLLLIHTNSTQRELTDYEKMEQISRVKKLLMQWREKEKVTGRTRDIIADLLDISASQIARMESINNNLIQDFKEWFEKGIINTSVAYEVSGMPEEKQKEFYNMATDQEQITLKDVKQEKKSCVVEKLETKNEVKKEAAQDNLTVEVNFKSEIEKEEVHEVEEEPLDGQMNVYDYPECLPEIIGGLCFTEWIYQRYGKSQFTLIKEMVRHQFTKVDGQSLEDIEKSIVNVISIWMTNKTKEYQEYLDNSSL